MEMQSFTQNKSVFKAQVTSLYEIAELIALVAVISATAPAIEKGLAEKRYSLS